MVSIVGNWYFIFKCLYINMLLLAHRIFLLKTHANYQPATKPLRVLVNKIIFLIYIYILT